MALNKDIMETYIRVIKEKYGDPLKNFSGQFIVPIGSDWKKNEDPEFNWYTMEEAARPSGIGEEIFRREYLQQPLISSTYGAETKIDKEEWLKTLEQARDKLVQIEAERKDMAWSSSNFDMEYNQGREVIKRSVSPQFQPLVLGFFERDPLNIDKDLILMKSRGSGMDYLQEMIQITKVIETLSKEFKEYIDRCAFAQGYVMTDDSLLPSDRVDRESLIDSVCNAIINDEDSINVAIMQSLEGVGVTPDMSLDVMEERLRFLSFRIDLVDHLYYIARLQNKLKAPRNVIVEKFRRSLLEYWPLRNRDELEMRMLRVGKINADVKRRKETADQLRKDFKKTLGSSGPGRDPRPPEKSSAIASATLQLKKKPETAPAPPETRDRALDF